MSKPLIASKPMVDAKRRQRERMAAAWHKAVFLAHGDKCYWCGKKATDAAHIIPRSRLGPLRYEMPVENGRPACRTCHELQERGMLVFEAKDLFAAVRHHNRIAKVPL